MTARALPASLRAAVDSIAKRLLIEDLSSGLPSSLGERAAVGAR